jgi:hypothetical protein
MFSLLSGFHLMDVGSDAINLLVVTAHYPPLYLCFIVIVIIFAWYFVFSFGLLFGLTVRSNS